MFLAWKMILRKKKVLFIQCLYLASLESKQKILYFAQTCQLLHFNYSGFFTPQSLLATKSCSATICELTHYSKLSPEYLTSLSTKSVCSEDTVFGDETARRQKQVCRWRPRLFLNEITEQMSGIKLWAASGVWLRSFSGLTCFRLQEQWSKAMTGGHAVLLLTKFNSRHHCPTSKLLGPHQRSNTQPGRACNLSSFQSRQRTRCVPSSQTALSSVIPTYGNPASSGRSLERLSMIRVV